MKFKTYDSLKAKSLLESHFSSCLNEASIGGFPFFKGTKNIFLVDKKEKPLSVVLYRDLEEGLVELDFIAVIKDFRDQGFGRSLIGQIEDRIWLEVHEDNQKAIAFYRGLGFRKTGFREAYYGSCGAFLMEKSP